MRKLIDEIHRSGFEISPNVRALIPSTVVRSIKEQIAKRLDDAEIFDIQNVADYLYTATDKEEWDLTTDFPNLAPPFQKFWMEFLSPAKIVSTESGITEFSYNERFLVGVLLTGRYLDQKLQNVSEQERLLLLDMGIGFAISALIFIKPIGRRAQVLPIEQQIIINKDGSIRKIGKYATFTASIIRDEQYLKDAERLAGSLLNPVWLAISFLHCKNVTASEKRPDKTLSRNFERKSGRPLVRFHTLVIEPMRRTLRAEGHEETTGIKRALHICRGHFKDYRESGLFGKIRGIFWWDSYVRGDAQEGITLKDYRITEPAQ